MQSFLYLGYLVVFVWSEERIILEASQVDWKVQAVAQTGRIVAIVIMIFLAQFLLALHRYCARLSEHYFVRSCGLFLSRGEIRNLGKTVIALDADHIDQKGVPRSPVRDIGAMVEKLTAVRKETDGEPKTG